jgi:hypothetical protein
MGMTRAQEILGLDYDAPARLADSVDYYEPKRMMALGHCGEPRRGRRRHGGSDVLGAWADRPNARARRPHRPYSYAAHYRLTADTVPYARRRADETRDVILKLHYLEFVLLRSVKKGKARMELQREVLATYGDLTSRLPPRCRPHVQWI